MILKKIKNPLLIIYIVGVITAWFCNYYYFSYWRKTQFQVHNQLTKGDVAFFTAMSFGSWFTVIAVGVFYIGYAVDWDKPANINL